MKSKYILTAVLLATIVCTIASVLITGRRPAEKSARQTVAAPAPIEIQPAMVSVEVATTSAPKRTAGNSAAPEKSSARADSQKQKAANSTKSKAPLQDPDARLALSLVGADPAAEQYWMAAISDPNLPDQEREDLMEDLNEDGLSDPKHPSAEDLQLVANRIPIIEEAALYAAQRGDAFMLEHLGEAYKDLNNLLAGLPVQ